MFKQIFIEESEYVAGTSKKPSLWRCYWRAYWPMILLAGFFKLGADLMIFVGPMCLDGIVNFVIENLQNNETETSVKQVWIYILLRKYYPPLIHHMRERYWGFHKSQMDPYYSISS